MVVVGLNDAMFTNIRVLRTHNASYCHEERYTQPTKFNKNIMRMLMTRLATVSARNSIYSSYHSFSLSLQYYIKFVFFLMFTFLGFFFFVTCF